MQTDSQAAQTRTADTCSTPSVGDDEVDCTWCGGEGTAECLDPLGCTVPHRFGDECICTACRGTGLRSQQTVF